MAAAAPLTDALNASPDQLTSMFKQHDQEDPDIEAHFTAKELSAMSDYEKKRLRNVKRNFLVMSALGLPIKLPKFMQPRKKKIREPSPPKKVVQGPPKSVEKKALKTDEEQSLPKPVNGEPLAIPVSELTKETLNDNAESSHSLKEDNGCPAILPNGALELNSNDMFDHTYAKLSDGTPIANNLDRNTLEQNGHMTVPMTESVKPVMTKKKTTKKVTKPKIKPMNGYRKDMPQYAPIPDTEQKTGDFRAFSSTCVDTLSRLMAMQLNIKDKLLEKCDNSDLEVEELEALDPIDPELFDTKPLNFLDRYPRRHIERPYYANAGGPLLENFTFCEECQQEYLGFCSEHPPANKESADADGLINDHTINGNVDDISKLFDFPFVIKPSGVSGNGVWSTKFIAKHSILGAFNGKSVTQTAQFSRFPYMWEFYEDGALDGVSVGENNGDRSWLQSLYDDGGLDGVLVGESNGDRSWLQSVCFAINEDQQNLAAFHHGGQIYYVTTKDIPANSELFVWYADDRYEQDSMGLKDVKPPKPVPKTTTFVPVASCNGSGIINLAEVDVANGEMADDIWSCDTCQRSFTSELFLIHHLYMKHDAPIPKHFVKKAVVPPIVDHEYATQTCKTETSQTDSLDSSVLQPEELVDYLLPRRQGDGDKQNGDGCQGAVTMETNGKQNGGEGCYGAVAKEMNGKEVAIETKGKSNGDGCHGAIPKVSNGFLHSQRWIPGLERSSVINGNQNGDSVYKGAAMDTNASLHDNKGEILSFENLSDKNNGIQNGNGCHGNDSMAPNASVQDKVEIPGLGEDAFKNKDGCCDVGFNVNGIGQSNGEAHAMSALEPNTCPYCFKTLNKKGALKLHVVEVHLDTRPYQCAFCPLKFRRPFSCKQHVEKIHFKPEVVLQCKVCNQRVSNKYALKLHENKHSNIETSFQCRYCTQSFKRFNTRFNHEKTQHMKGASLSENTGEQLKVHVE